MGFCLVFADFLTFLLNVEAQNAGIHSTCLCIFLDLLLFLAMWVFVPKTERSE